MADFILACDDAGKIFRYDGSTWTAVYTNGHAGLTVQQLFSPKNAPNVVIALYGTDTFDPSFGYLNGILHSTDAGATWAKVTATGTSGSVWQGICHAAPTALPGLSMFQVSDGAQTLFETT